MRIDDMAVEVQQLLPAPPEQVFALLTDVERMAGLGPENVRTAWQDDRRGVGAVFRGVNDREGRTWEAPCQVVEHERPARFAWSVGNPELPAALWSYDLAPAGGGTLVTHQFRHGPGSTFVRRAVAEHPEREAEIVAGRAAELERNMRTVLQAAADLLAGPSNQP